MNRQLIKRIGQLYISYWFNRGWFKPDRINWYLTNKCNLRCLKCDIWDTPLKGKDDINLEEAKKIIDNAVHFGIKIIGLVGGEPFIWRGIEEFLRYCRFKNMIVMATTNGLFLHERFIDLLIELNYKHTGFSIDGSTAEVHDYLVSRPGAFNIAMHNFDLYVAKGGEPHISTVICPKNAHQLVDIYYMTRKHGARGIVYQPFHNRKPFTDKPKDFMNFSKEQLKVALEEIDELIKLKKSEKIGGFSIFNSLKYLKGIKDFIANKYKEVRRPCFASYLHVSINNKGGLMACPPYAKTIIGNLVEESLEILWNSLEFNKMRKELKNLPVCANCFLTGQAEESFSYYPGEIFLRSRYGRWINKLKP